MKNPKALKVIWLWRMKLSQGGDSLPPTFKRGLGRGIGDLIGEENTPSSAPNKSKFFLTLDDAAAKINRVNRFKHVEDDLKSIFGTKVSILDGKKEGKIEIEYYSLQQLENIIRLIKKLTD
jgi:hypothetical protein